MDEDKIARRDEYVREVVFVFRNQVPPFIPVPRIGENLVTRSRLSMMFVCSICVLTVGLIAHTSAASQEKLEVNLSRIARITGQASGNYQFFRVAGAPDDANRAMVCTLHWNASTNAGGAELFTSMDGGETWNLRLTDGSSREVSEDACAFGEGGRAYFIAQPWDINDPNSIRPSIDKSEMHFYRSSDHGETWPAHLTSAFMDYARIAVDTRADSPFRGRAYVAGNRTAKTAFPLLAILQGGQQLVEAKQTTRLKDAHERGGHYPRSIVVLRNGDVLASYHAGSGEVGRYRAVVTVSRDGGKTVDGPVTIDTELSGGSGVPSLDENPRDGAVYAFYATKRGDLDVPMVASSVDGGQTWKRAATLIESVVEPSKHKIFLPSSIAFRNDGTALLTWVADSAIRGALFYDDWKLLWTGELSSHLGDSGINPFPNTSFPYVRGDFRTVNGKFTDANGDMNIRLQFESTNYPEVDAVLMADGGFLVVWQGGDGQLYSRSIHASAPSVPARSTEMPTRDVTALVKYEARNISFDANTNIFEYDLELVNVSDVSLPSPFLIKIKEISSTIGPATVQGLSGGGLILVGQRSEMLLPGEHTAPLRVRIQASPTVSGQIATPSNRDPGIGLIGRVYAKSSEAPHN